MFSMAVPRHEGMKMEGWLHAVKLKRFGLRFSRKRYFVLEDNCLKFYKSIPVLQDQEPERSAIIDSCIRVTDNGRKIINRKVFFVFTLYSTLNHNDRLKLGVRSPEDAARWVSSLQDAAAKESSNATKDFVAISKRKSPPLRLTVSKRNNDHKRSIGYHSTLDTEATTSDVIAPSPWRIFGCQNGLRLFKEANVRDPALMAVGVVDGTSDSIFQTLMSLCPSRSEWDFCFYRGNVVEHLDGHTDIIHQKLSSDWLPRAKRRRDLLLRRYWRREDDGAYVILYHSVIHKSYPPQRGYVRAFVKSGGYVVSPVNQGRQSLVKHVLAVDWKYWRLFWHRPSSRSITIRALQRVAALRELFQAKAGTSSSGFYSTEAPTHLVREDGKTISQGPEKDEEEKLSLGLNGLDDASDEFFDVPESEDTVDFSHFHEQYLTYIAFQKKGYIELQHTYGATLQKDPSFTLPCSWAVAETTFLIRGENYLKDHKKIEAKSTLMQLVGVDWLRSDQREDNISGHPNSIVQKYAAQKRPEFFFIVNYQIPGGATTMYTLALYYMLKTPLEGIPLLHKFVNGDDAHRNSRFKLIPYISKGAWIVKQSIGKKACLIGQALDVHYFRGKNYLEVEIDVGSSAAARGLASLVHSYLTNLVIEMAFLIQGNTKEELPEFLLGTCRLNNLDSSKSVVVR